jgi:hypothetical protein
MTRAWSSGPLGLLGALLLVAAPAAVVIGCGEATGPADPAAGIRPANNAPPPPPTTGSILVSTVTLGGGIDADFNSYTIELGRERKATVGANASTLITGLGEGTYSVKLTNTSNCLIPNGNPRPMTVTAGRVTRTIFRIHC